VRHLERRVVDEYVKTSEFLEHPIDQFRAVLFIADIARQRERTAPRGGDPPAGFTGVALFFRKITDGDIGPFSSERDGDGSAYPAVGTGDECGPAGKAPEAPVGLFPVIGPGIHLGI
jgi:hypothetical protein